MNDLLYDIWLYSIQGIGPIKFRRIKEHFGSVKNFYMNFDSDYLKTLNVNISMIDRDLKSAEKIIDYCYKNEIEIISFDSDFYPKEFLLYEDAPPIIFIKGDKKTLKHSMKIAIVGTRQPTFYGKNIAKQITEILVQNNIVTVSGMARGIDSVVHNYSVGYGKTVAVLGSGVDIVYPKENYSLYKKIIDNGCVISEYLPKTLPSKGNFPQRNRIISMLSHLLIVIEAGEKSGVFSTVDFALSQGKDIFAVPGPITSKKSFGTNKLIRDGARIIISIEDFIDDLSLLLKQKLYTVGKETYELTNDEKYILSLIEERGKIDISDLINIANFQPKKLLSILTELEIKNKIARTKGNFIEKI